mmetsp:Transcript_79422/g.184301  ORF Transcript_79422/g.184301 Transcript_79422/m.184301 type:complete len:299 (+) Transcript_79422:82-978(+)
MAAVSALRPLAANAIHVDRLVGALKVRSQQGVVQWKAVTTATALRPLLAAKAIGADGLVFQAGVVKGRSRQEVSCSVDATGPAQQEAVSTATALRPLVAAKTINVGRLAGAIKSRVQQGSPCSVDAVGPEAQHKAVKALIMASRFLQEDGHPGKRMAFMAEKHELAANSPKPPTSMVRLHGRLFGELAVPESPDLFISGNTNPGLAAKDLASILKEAGLDGVASMGGMGALAMSRALKALIIARAIMRRAGAMGRHEVLVAMPQLLQVQVHDEERFRFVLNCTRQSWHTEELAPAEHV